LVDALTGAVFSSYRPTRFTDRRQIDPSDRNMMEVSIGKYCQFIIIFFIIIFTKYWGNIITYIPPRISGDRPNAPLNFPVMPAGLSVEVIAKVPSRFYRVPHIFSRYLPWRTIGSTDQHQFTAYANIMPVCVTDSDKPNE